jgi:hypothetical protein
MPNPEFLRNARIQLRPGRAIAAAIISAAVSLTIWYSYSYGTTGTGSSVRLFETVLQLQIFVLLIGGGIYELLSVHREKELNTFDYQRVTRLTALELATGKLLGAPILTYFIVLCLMPLAITGAFLGQIRGSLVVDDYVVLFLGCLAYHALALLSSTTLGRGVSAIAVLPFLILVAFTSADYANAQGSNWMLHQLSPFAASSFAEFDVRGLQDTFFGHQLPHFYVLLVIFVTLTAWFLLGIVRNLKRDPALYEIYSPLQAFGFVMYLELIALGFFNWKSPNGAPIFDGQVFKGFAVLAPLDIERGLLFSSFWIFGLLGFILLRNREQVRRRIQALGDGAASLWSSVWPAPYLLAGVIVVGIAIVELIEGYRRPAPEEWNWSLALLYVAFCALWLIRDVLYLQWMSLRRTRRPLISALLYLIVFYVCVSVVLGVTNLMSRPASAPYAAMLIPTPAFSLSAAGWARNQHEWLVALAALATEAVVFAFLQRQKLREFLVVASSAVAPPAAAPAPPDGSQLTLHS